MLRSWILIPTIAVIGLIGLYSYLPNVNIEKNVSKSNVTRIGLIADTHVPDRARGVPKRVFEVFRKAEVDYINSRWRYN